MARKCSINIKKGVLSGNNISHSHHKTRRRFLPNIQNYSLLSDTLGIFIKFKTTPSTVRSIEHNDGIDNYLLTTPNSKLAPQAKTIKKRILKAQAKKTKA